ncbi:MAG TPA: response regulator [Casimicrobiaceae bacterium]|nr:response regulator [Casimicrobiaceae bacterium]
MTKKILIADDEPNIVVSLEFLMKQKGYAVKVVSNGKDALDAIADFAPDLVLLDVMMPVLSGYELAQKVRANPAWAGIRIIMLSAKGRDVEVTKGMAVGADAYVTKPFSTKDLVAKVEELLREAE